MATATNLALAGTAPVSVTYQLMTRSAVDALWHDRRRSNTSLVGTLRMYSEPIREPNGRTTGKYKVGGHIMEPVVRTINGLETAMNPCTFKCEFRISELATDAEKAHLRKLAVSMIDNAIFVACQTTGEALT